MPSQIDQVLAYVQDVAEHEIAPRASAVDADGAFPSEALRALAGRDALGILVPDSAGGAGGGLAALVEACESIGGACGSSAMVYLMHCVASATVAAGGGRRAGELLPAMASGDRLATLAFSERGTGAHFYAPELGAERINGSVRISGRKSFVTSGGHADVYLVLVQSEDGGFDCFAVDRDDRVRFEGSWDGLGMTGNSSVAMVLDDVEVGADDLIGAAGQGQDLVFGAVAPAFLAGLAAVNTGIATAALAAATSHAAERQYADGSRLAEVQSIQHSLADMDIAVRGTRLLVREAARLGDTGDEAALLALMEAKVAATEAAAEVTQTALEVCGGQGYSRSLPVERHLRDARAGAVMAPTNSVLRSWIGKALAGLPVP